MSKNNSKGFGCIVVLLIISISLNVFFVGCERKSHNQPQDASNIDVNINNQLQNLAKTCGVKNTNSVSDIGLISEIKIKLNNKEQYYGKHLTKEDFSNLESYLADDPQILKIIKEYYSFMQTLNNKSFVIIP